jgi:hypothetical protein
MKMKEFRVARGKRSHCKLKHWDMIQGPGAASALQQQQHAATVVTSDTAQTGCAEKYGD